MSIKDRKIETNLSSLSLLLLCLGGIGFFVSQVSTSAVSGWLAFGGFFLVFGTALIAVMINFQNRSRQRSIANKINDIASGNISAGVDLGAENNDELNQAIQNLLDYLNDKASLIDKIAAGDLTAKVEMRSMDDTFGNIFQNMLEKLQRVVQTEDERNGLRNSISKLLSEVSEIAQGDLTVEAEVGNETTGALADAFNFMTSELRALIKQVKNVTFEVTHSAQDISKTTGELAEGSETQAVQIAQTSQAVEDMALQIQEVSINATMSAKVAGESLNMAQHGTQAVQDNIDAMNRIRNQVQETAKRIKKLGERSQEISEIVQLLDELSERTSLLALNASLQAAAAGEAGRGFAAVTEEVERLAERSNRAAQKIATLAQSIQYETKDVVSSMEETIHEVVVGSTLADKAGQTLTEIEKVSNQLADLIKLISESARHQAAGSESISKAMASISKVTELVNSGSKKAVNSSKNLVTLSDHLSNSVATFKLPEDKKEALDIPPPGKNMEKNGSSYLGLNGSF
ncbi:MAG TPA: methyl-accepting chemotaxis protein [Pyrinomonadaceae bacterium]|jgi:twitching motility protein PilJ|nr:methyl-accepting chemotaxis protein [Pyrinomonadaceae bacterium]